MFHIPALLQPVCELLEPSRGKLFADVTLGGAGHTLEFLRRGASVIGIDLDQSSIDHASGCEALQPALASRQLRLVKGNFACLPQILDQLRVSSVDAVFADLGVSSHQLDTPSRGFSYLRPGPLDMRLDPSQPLTAAAFLSQLNAEALRQTLVAYAELKNAGRIASRIVSHFPISTTSQLARAVGDQRLLPQVFQALRIAVNRELDNLSQLLRLAPACLKPGGVFAIITFHSLEDRLVKLRFNELVAKKQASCLTCKPVVPSASEISANPRSRSAKLRAIKIL